MDRLFVNGQRHFVNGHAPEPVVAYNYGMLNYFSNTVPLDLDTEHQFRLLITVFVATYLSVIALHLFLPVPQQVSHLLLHGLFIAAAYTIATVIVAILAWFAGRQLQIRSLRVWHLWLASFAVYNIGFFLAPPMGQELRLALHADLQQGATGLHYLRLVPIWLLFTAGFINVFVGQQLRNELAVLRAINRGLDAHQEPGDTPGCDPEFAGTGIPTSTISHASVIDHYCYVHYQSEDGWQKTDVAQSLSNLVDAMPTGFIQVHRSHVVNPAHIRAIERDGRSYKLALRSGHSVPVARSRVGDVLPRLQALT